MWLFVGILINSILLLIWGQFVRIAIGSTRRQYGIVALSIGTALYLSFLPVFWKQFHIPWLLYTDTISTERASILSIVGAIALLVSVLYILLRRRPSLIATITFGCFLLLYLIITHTPWSLLPASVVLWMVIAIIEEWIKTSTTTVVRDKYRILDSDVILFGVLVALGFAFLENILYLWYVGTSDILIATSLIIKRSLTARTMHLTYTGCIAIGITYLAERTAFIWKTLIAIIIGVGLHILYNLFLDWTNIWGVLLLLLIGYFFLTWLVYKSERVYLSP